MVTQPKRPFAQVKAWLAELQVWRAKPFKSAPESEVEEAVAAKNAEVVPFTPLKFWKVEEAET